MPDVRPVTRALCVAVFAHDEERNIERCLDSVRAATDAPERLDVTVLVNGSTDDSAAIVARYGERYPEFTLVELALGDKSNAWNHYVWECASPAHDHFFLDGDNWLPALALDAVVDEWNSREHWGLATAPIGIKEGLRRTLQDNGWISGNFYGLSAAFVTAVREAKFRIPTGFIGDDSVVMYLLQEGFGDESKERRSVQFVASTGPVIPRIALSPRNLLMLHERYKRYALRHFQQEVLYHLGRSGRLSDLPEEGAQAKSHLSELGWKPYLAWHGVQTLYHPYAVLKMLRS